MTEENNFQYPTTMKYFCQIHQTTETATFKGIQKGLEGEVLALYNTPLGYTFCHQTIKDIQSGKWDAKKWKEYEQTHPPFRQS